MRRQKVGEGRGCVSFSLASDFVCFFNYIFYFFQERISHQVFGGMHESCDVLFNCVLDTCPDKSKAFDTCTPLNVCIGK